MSIAEKQAVSVVAYFIFTCPSPVLLQQESCLSSKHAKENLASSSVRKWNKSSGAVHASQMKNVYFAGKTIYSFKVEKNIFLIAD